MTADTVGGVWTYAMDLCAGLREHGVQVTLATMGGKLDPRRRSRAQSLGNVELRESDFALEWMDNPWEDVAAAAEWLLRLERSCRPDVVHLNGYAHGVLPWSAPVLMVGHSCVLSWWRAVHEADAPAEWNTYRAAVTKGLRSADLVVAPTNSMLNALRDHYGPFPRSGVILNGRDPTTFMRRTGAKQPLVAAVGRLWDPAKNIAVLDEIAPDLPWDVAVAGAASHPDGSIREFRHVRALGILDDAELGSLLTRASIYVLPAVYEPFGLSIVEAALSGCALVLGDIASLRELWDGAAVFVDPHDAPGIQAAITSFITDDARRTAFAARAFVRAQNYSAQRLADQYASEYRNLAITRPAARAHIHAAGAEAAEVRPCA